MKQQAKSEQNKNAKLERSVDLAVREIDESTRTVELSFSSELPYQRWFGMEILSHDDGAVNLERLKQIGILLFNHDRDYILGKVLEVSITDGRGIAKVQFDEDEKADIMFQKVKSGTLKGVSVGYRVDVWEEVMAGSKSVNGKFDGPCSIAAKWTPFEISIVSIPADESVGVGRDFDDDEDINKKHEQTELLRQQISNKILFNLGGKC